MSAYTLFAWRVLPVLRAPGWIRWMNRGRSLFVGFSINHITLSRVLILDNGSGMNDDTLMDAMRFGGKNEKDDDELGKYGIGLKTASLSQAKTVTVRSRRGGAYTRRGWTDDLARYFS